jgi:hypothetical protein
MYRSIFKQSNGTSLGLGDKHFLPKHVLLNAANTPGPNQYDVNIKEKRAQLQKNLPQMTKGTFGAPREAYSKLSISTLENFDSDLPGPGQYSVSNALSRNQNSFTIKGKWPDPYVERIPAPNQYTPKSEVVSNTRYKTISIGNNRRFLINQSVSPGPGSYNISKPFGKLDALKNYK